MKFMVRFLILAALGLTTQVMNSIAHAETCEIENYGGFSRIFVGTGASKRSPRMDEVMNAMNAKNSTLFEDLKYVEGRQDQPRVFLDVPKEPLFYDFRTLPSPGINDFPACSKLFVNGKRVAETGYDCRVRQVKEMDGTNGKPDAHGMPKGIKTGVSIQVPIKSLELMARITKDLGCEDTFLESGAAAGAPTSRAIPLVSPAAGAATKP